MSALLFYIGIYINRVLIVLFRAFEMMKNRGQRSWSVGLSMADITNSILTDKNKVHSVSTLAQV